MVKASTMQRKRWALMVLLFLSVSTVCMILVRSSFETCSISSQFVEEKNGESSAAKFQSNPLDFMKSKLVLLVSHELSLSGGPLLLMELAFLLRGVGADVVWITNQKPLEDDEVVYSLEHKMLDRGVQVISAKGQKAVDTSLKADLIVLNTAVAGKWLDAVLKENGP